MSDDRSAFGVSNLGEGSISGGDVVLWLVCLVVGLGFAVFVRTMIIRHMRRQIREQQREFWNAVNRRKRGSGTMTRQVFVEQNLNSYQWNSSSSTEDQDSEELRCNSQSSECSICLSPLRCGDMVSKSNNIDCNHVFHTQCVKEWLILHVECPMCRKEYLIPPIFYSLQENTEWTDSLRTAAATVEEGTEERTSEVHSQVEHSD